MGKKYKFSEAELEEIQRARHLNTKQASGSASEGTGTARKEEKQQRNRRHYRIPSSVYHNIDSEIPCRRDRGNQQESLRRKPPEHELGARSGTTGGIREAKKRKLWKYQKSKQYEDAVGHKIGSGQIYEVLARHEWRKVMLRIRHPGGVTIKLKNQTACESCRRSYCQHKTSRWKRSR